MNAQSSRVIPISDARRKADAFAAWQRQLDYDAWLHAQEVRARLLAKQWHEAQRVSLRDAVIVGICASVPTAMFFLWLVGR